MDGALKIHEFSSVDKILLLNKNWFKMMTIKGIYTQFNKLAT
jgi:hypothetical protein